MCNLLTLLAHGRNHQDTAQTLEYLFKYGLAVVLVAETGQLFFILAAAEAAAIMKDGYYYHN
jgi:hypothetical protein